MPTEETDENTPLVSPTAKDDAENEQAEASGVGQNDPATAEPVEQVEHSPAPDTEDSSQPETPRDALLSVTFGLYIVVGLFAIANMFRNGRLPKPEKYKPSPSMPFDLDNAMRHITHLAKRDRYVGTQGLEDGMQYILKELELLQPVARQNGFELDLELTRSDPSNYRLMHTSMKKLVNSYDNLTNVIARLRPASIPFDTDLRPLLINAHVDSALAAPGVSDILSGVGIVLDLVRAVASRPADEEPLTRPVIFLLNGGEEPVLAAAHAFVTQHPWGRASVAFINLESMGAGNAFHLFRVGPDNPWLGRVYAKAVSLPTGTVAATDVFNMNLIPAETDYTIFTRYGGIPGYDFALLDNGYIYHTRYDDMAHLNTQGVLHGGITSYELMMELAGKNDAIGAHLAGTEETGRLSAASARIASKIGLVRDLSKLRFAFFDILYMFTVYYEEGIAAMIHSLIIVFAALVCVVKIGVMTRDDRISVLRMTIALMFAVVAGFASATFASAVYVHVLGAVLPWYGSAKKALIIFLPPAMFGICGVLLLLLPRKLRADRYDHMLLPCIAVQIFLAYSAVRHSLMMAYLPCGSLLVLTFCLLRGDATMPIAKHFAIMLVHSSYLEKLYHMCLCAFLPLVGRVKTEKIPQDTVAALVVMVLSMPYMIIPSLPLLVHYAQSLRKLRGILFAVCLWTASYFMLIAPVLNGESGLTPYSKSAPKRLIATHFHSPQLEVESVLHISGLGPGKVDVERLMAPLVGTDSDVGSVAGVPTFGSLKSEASEAFRKEAAYVQNTYVFRSGNKPRLDVPTVELTEETRIEEGWNVTLAVDAKESHMVTVRLPTGRSLGVTSWSFEAGVEEFGEELWFRHFGSTHLEFWVVLRQAGKDDKRPTLKAAVTSTRLGVSRSPNDLAKLNITSWESVTLAVSTGIEVDL